MVILVQGGIKVVWVLLSGVLRSLWPLARTLGIFLIWWTGLFGLVILECLALPDVLVVPIVVA